MPTIWFLIIVTVSATGEVTSDIQFPNTSKDNTKELCEYWGARTSLELGAKLGDKYKIFWRCQDIDTRDLSRAL